MIFHLPSTQAYQLYCIFLDAIYVYMYLTIVEYVAVILLSFYYALGGQGNIIIVNKFFPPEKIHCHIICYEFFLQMLSLAALLYVSVTEISRGGQRYFFSTMFQVCLSICCFNQCSSTRHPWKLEASVMHVTIKRKKFKNRFT